MAARAAGRDMEVTRCGDRAAGSQQAHRGVGGGRHVAGLLADLDGEEVVTERIVLDRIGERQCARSTPRKSPVEILGHASRADSETGSAIR